MLLRFEIIFEEYERLLIRHVVPGDNHLIVKKTSHLITLIYWLLKRYCHRTTSQPLLAVVMILRYYSYARCAAAICGEFQGKHND